jgi:hypothetical protein
MDHPCNQETTGMQRYSLPLKMATLPGRATLLPQALTSTPLIPTT